MTVENVTMDATPDGAASVLTEMLAVEHAPTPKNRCVVRLRTTTWRDKNGLHLKKSLTFLRRQCVGFNILEEDAGSVGAEEVLPKIENLSECNDGIYEAVVCNERRDWETGYVDDYDYRLGPLETANVKSTVIKQVDRISVCQISWRLPATC